MTTTSRLDHRTRRFAALFEGEVIRPEEDAYATARMAWNLAVDQRPAVVVRPADATEVVRAVEAAARSGLRIAAQGTGHNAGPMGSLYDVVLLKTDRMRDVHIDPVRRTALVGAGVLWEEVVTAAAEHGLAALHGSSPNVGVVGYVLGGGISCYARSYGLTSNSLVGVDIVLADGAHIRADAEQNVEVFWAVRGGGGNFGVITAVELQLFEIATAYAGMMVWDQVHAETVLRSWRDWTTAAPDAITTTFRLMNFPPLQEIPEPLRGRRVVIVDGVALADADRGREMLAALRDLGPELDTFEMSSPESLVHLHMDPAGPLPVVSDSAVLDGLDDAAMVDLLQIAGPSAPPRLLAVELRHLGGALSRAQAGAGALSHLAGQFLLFALTVAPSPQAAADGRAAATTVVAGVARHGAEATYLNFAEHPTDVRASFDSLTWRDLVWIKSAIDPTDLFVANHPIPTLYQDGMPTTTVDATVI